MRGEDRRSGELFSYVNVEERIRVDHPLRMIKVLVNEALEALNAAFSALYAHRLGRPSIPPERLLRARLLQALHSIRSERQLMERLEFYLLFRWFVGPSAAEPKTGATLGADKAYKVWTFKRALRDRGVIPHIALRSKIGWSGLSRRSPA